MGIESVELSEAINRGENEFRKSDASDESEDGGSIVDENTNHNRDDGREPPGKKKEEDSKICNLIQDCFGCDDEEGNAGDFFGDIQGINSEFNDKTTVSNPDRAERREGSRPSIIKKQDFFLGYYCCTVYGAKGADKGLKLRACCYSDEVIEQEMETTLFFKTIGCLCLLPLSCLTICANDFIGQNICGKPIITCGQFNKRSEVLCYRAIWKPLKRCQLPAYERYSKLMSSKEFDKEKFLEKKPFVIELGNQTTVCCSPIYNLICNIFSIVGLACAPFCVPCYYAFTVARDNRLINYYSMSRLHQLMSKLKWSRANNYVTSYPELSRIVDMEKDSFYNLPIHVAAKNICTNVGSVQLQELCKTLAKNYPDGMNTDNSDGYIPLHLALISISKSKNVASPGFAAASLKYFLRYTPPQSIAEVFMKIIMNKEYDLVAKIMVEKSKTPRHEYFKVRR